MTSAEPEPPRVSLSGVRVVAMDLDDTLYPEQAYVFSGYDAVGQWLRRRRTCPTDPAARMRELFLAGERRQVFDRLLAEYGASDAALIADMVTCYRTHTPALEYHPDATLALEQWRGRFKLAVISDGPLIMQQRKAAALQVERWCDCLVLTDQWGSQYWKPDPRSFEFLETRLGLGGAACLYIADNPAKDFVAPRALGWRTVQIRRAGGFYGDQAAPPGGQPELVVSSLLQLDLSS